ncbi:chymotrypsin inhibitor [Megalopta genalis]|uniref:chymotrypsin inhibitor n=1 Tax=Megalopta genalis TaxID=115081 RepID=UPI003FD01D68
MFKLLVAMTVLAVVAAQSSIGRPKCSENESWSICGHLCEPSCEHPIVTPSWCGFWFYRPCKGEFYGCRCKNGYVRNDKKHCVEVKDCPHKS